MIRVGIGYDIHRLVEGRKLVIGGVEIPYPRGLWGHSDADVLVHALCDALLGAAGLGDIGQHFPDTDPAYKDIDSMELLSHTNTLIADQGLKLGNVDAIIFAEKPAMSSYKNSMQINLAQTLTIPPQRVNIKATTTEGLGAIGKGAGIGAMVIVVLQPV